LRPADAGRLVVAAWLLAWLTVRAIVLWAIARRHRTLAAAGANGLVDAFERLGPTFVKLGQLIASSPGLFPAPLADAALRCLDEVPPFPASVARRMVAEDLGRPADAVFESFDDEPLSAASIAQVHACVLPGGR